MIKMYLSLFIYLFISFEVAALSVNDSQISGIAATANLNFCAIMRADSAIAATIDTIEKRLQETNNPELSEALKASLEAFRTGEKDVQKRLGEYRFYEMATISLVASRGDDLKIESGETLTTKGSIKVWKSGPAAQIIIFGSDICDYISDVDSLDRFSQVQLSKEQVVDFLNDISQ